MAKFNPNDYEDVASRIRRFKKDWPDSQIVTELVESVGNIGATRWVVKASIWRERGHDRPDSTGYAFEVDGTGMANKTSALENGETSAIGRALANLNYSGDKRASREEMEKVQRAEARHAELQEFAVKLEGFEKAGERHKIEAMFQWAAKKGDGQMRDIAQGILNRMPDQAQAVSNAQEVLDAEVVNNEPA